MGENPTTAFLFHLLWRILGSGEESKKSLRLNRSKDHNPRLCRMFLQVGGERLGGDPHTITDVRRVHIVKRSILHPNRDSSMADVEAFLLRSDGDKIARLNFGLENLNFGFRKEEDRMQGEFRFDSRDASIVRIAVES